MMWLGSFLDLLRPHLATAQLAALVAFVLQVLDLRSIGGGLV